MSKRGVQPKLVRRNCEFCNAIFYASQKNACYCSDKCRLNAHRERKRVTKEIEAFAKAPLAYAALQSLLTQSPSQYRRVDIILREFGARAAILALEAVYDRSLRDA